MPNLTLPESLEELPVSSDLIEAQCHVSGFVQSPREQVVCGDLGVPLDPIFTTTLFCIVWSFIYIPTPPVIRVLGGHI